MISNLGDYYAREIGTLLALLFLLPILGFCVGWWCGDRLDVPSVSIEVR